MPTITTVEVGIEQANNVGIKAYRNFIIIENSEHDDFITVASSNKIQSANLASFLAERLEEFYKQ